MKLANSQFDISGSRIGRTWRQGLIYGLLPVGRAARAGGPGWGLCARLWLWHRFGGELFQLVMRFEKQAIAGYAFMTRFSRRTGIK
jgi:hypothetical protein